MNVYCYLSIPDYLLHFQDQAVQRHHYIYNHWVDRHCMAIQTVNADQAKEAIEMVETSNAEMKDEVDAEAVADLDVDDRSF